jgi:sulfur carrier protein
MTTTVTVNGKPRELAEATDLPAFLARHEINPRLVAVAINGEVIPKGAYDGAIVRPGDNVEIVRMVGGG